MMQEVGWTKSEKAVARRAFEQAYERESAELAKEVRRLANTIVGADDIWGLHDFLTEHRKAMDEKYDYRYSQLLFVFARLMDEGWIKEGELEGIGDEKIQRIRALIKFMND